MNTIKDLRILFVDNFKLDFDNPMSTLYINKCKKICSSPFVTKVDITEQNQVEEALKQPHEIILLGQRCPPFYKCNKRPSKTIEANLLLLLSKSAAMKRFLLLQDTHPKTYGSLEELVGFINKWSFDLIFTFYQNRESKFIRDSCPKSRHLHLPHHIDTAIFKPIMVNEDGKRSFDVILYGDTHPTHYPFRKRLFDLLLRDGKMLNLKILHITPPVGASGKIFDPDKCEKGLAAKISNAKFAIATKSKYDYLVAKYLEIAACGTVVIGDMATDGLHLPEFKKNYIKVDSRMSDRQILDIIVNAVDDYDTGKNTVCSNRESFSQHILDNYNLDSYLKKLLDFLFK